MPILEKVEALQQNQTITDHPAPSPLTSTVSYAQDQDAEDPTTKRCTKRECLRATLLFSILFLCILLGVAAVLGIVINYLVQPPNAYYLQYCFRTATIDTCNKRNCYDIRAEDSDTFNITSLDSTSFHTTLQGQHYFTIAREPMTRNIYIEYTKYYNGTTGSNLIPTRDEFYGVGQTSLFYEMRDGDPGPYSSDALQHLFYYKVCGTYY
jgi:hypothetical protein